MGNIYKITNLINQKSYIGKTENKNPYTRWKEHQYAAKNNAAVQNYPIYKAINKYGIENFTFEIIEQTLQTREREIYWISFYNTYSTGYNATLGGDGGCIINSQEVLHLYSKGYNCRQIAEQMKHNEDSIAKILHHNGVVVKPSSYYRNKEVSQYSKKGEFIQDFVSLSAAALWCKEQGLLCGQGNVTNISNVCRNKAQTAYGYIWKYKEKESELNKPKPKA